MGEDRAGVTRGGAVALPLTRRQQKRARQQRAQPAHRPQQLPTQYPPTSQAPAPLKSRAASVDTPPARAATGTRAAPAQKTAKTAKTVKATKTAKTATAAAEDTVARSASARRAPKAAETATIESSATATPRAPTQGSPKKSRSHVPVDVDDGATAPVAVPAPIIEPSSGKKHPTLADMAALGARGDATPEPQLLPSRSGRQRRSEALDEPLAEDDRTQGSRAPNVAASVPAPRAPVVTRRLAHVAEVSAPLPDMNGEPPAAETAPQVELSPRVSAAGRPRPLPRLDLVVPVACAHAIVAAAAALTGAALLLQGDAHAVWPLLLTVIGGAGGWLAYVLAQRGHLHRSAGSVLLVSQLGVLAWLMVLLGPRGAILLLAPAMLLLALRTAGRRAAVLGALGVLGIFIVESLLVLTNVFAPVLHPSAGVFALIDGLLICGGLGTLLAALVAFVAAQERAELSVRARLHEARQVTARTAGLRHQIDDDTERLQDALARSLQGRGIEPVEVGGQLSPLAESVEIVADRLATLQQDREDRIRLEGALRTLIREVERAWLGLPWAWPAASGTTLDELVALLRAPRPGDTPPAWHTETPTLIPIPSLGVAPTSRPWETVYASHPSYSSHPSQPGAGSSGRHAMHQLPLALEDDDGLMTAPLHVTQLPWKEWNAWHDWDPSHQLDSER